MLIKINATFGIVWVKPENVDAVDFQQEGVCTIWLGDFKLTSSVEEGQRLLAEINDRDGKTNSESKDNE